MSIWTWTFWKAASDRGIRTTVQAFAAALPATALTLGEVNWVAAGTTGVLAGIASLGLSMMTGLPEVKDSK